MKTKVRKSKECFLSEEFLKKTEVQKVVSSDIDCRLKDQRSNLPSEEELYYRKREEELLLRAKDGLFT